MTEYLDRATYAGYDTGPSVNVDGGYIQWVGVPAAEFPKILPRIIQAVELYAFRYGVELEIAPDRSHIYLKTTFSTPATPAMVLNHKGELSALWMATSWGGPG